MKESLKTKKEESKMKKLLRNQAGFTLVELMIVIVIVGILAAVAVPIYQSNITKAKMSECDAALGTIRTALRISYAEHGNYPVVATGTEVTAATGLDISATDLQGTYFDPEDYTLVSDSLAVTYTITCTNTDIFDVERTLNQDGIFAGGP
jgi:prepilin-type N-terminal cleavage/methylation domain-containing protein